MNHPEDLLAAYVDGTASLSERAQVEAHLTFCALCREEIELARRARQALVALDDVEPPELDRSAFHAPAPTAAVAEVGVGSRGRFVEAPDAPVESRHAVTPLPVRSRRPGSRPPGDRSRWVARAAQASLAAAAVLVAVVVVANLRGGSGGGNAAAPLQREHAAASPGSASDGAATSAQAFTQKSLTRLAENLVGEVRTAHAVAGSPAAPAPQDTASASLSDRTAACAQQATGLITGTSLYYAQGGVYEGRAAYIGAFIAGSGSNRSLLVIAVSSDDCQTLRFIRLSI